MSETPPPDGPNPNKSNQIINELENTSKRQNQIWVNKHFKDWLLIIATLILAFFTASLWFETHKSVLLVNDSISEMKKSNNLFEKNFLIENRAWVGLTESPVNGVFHIKNLGKTPALNVKVAQRLYHSNLIKIKIWPGDFINFGTLSQNETRDLPFISIHPPSFRKLGDILRRLKHQYVKSIIFYNYLIIIYQDIYGGIDTTELTYTYDIKDTSVLISGTISRMK